MKNISVIKVLICAAILVALFSPVQTVSAGQPTTIFEVDTFEDLVDIYPNGICSVGDFNGGPCSLRAAIYDATSINAAGENLRILLPPGTYELTQTEEGSIDAHYGDLDLKLINDSGLELSVTIEGTGPGPSIIDARMIDRVLEIWATTAAGNKHSVILRNLEIRNGLIKSTSSDAVYGGGVYSNLVNLTVENVRFVNNESRGRTQGESYQSAFGGGMIASNGNLFMTDSEFLGNKADSGSALDLWDGATPYAYYSLVQRTSFHHNLTTGVDFPVINSHGIFYLVNSVIAQNGSTNGTCVGVRSVGTVNIQSSTLQKAGSGVNLNCSLSSCNIRNSALITDEMDGQIGQNCGGPSANITSEGGNVMDDNSCYPDPTLNDLVIPRENWRMGFAGKYLLPTIGSPVINHVPGQCRAFGFYQAAYPEEGFLTVDQRQLNRDDGACDTGSIEFQTPMFIPVIFK